MLSRTAPLLFATALSVLTGILFGLTPAFGATRASVATALKPGTSASGMTRRWSGRYVLVVAQIAMGLVLTFGAALLVRTLQNLQHVDGGFNTGNVLVFALDARDTRFPPSVWSVCAAMCWIAFAAEPASSPHRARR